MSYTTKYDKQLKTLSHYQNYPQMLPFIGEDYDIQSQRLLIIAESHYLPENSSLDLSKWYEMDETSLSEAEKEYINSREVLLAHYKNQRLIFKPIADAILEYGFNLKDSSNVFKYVAWYNFFQRPAEVTGESIKPTKEDREKAEEAFEHIFQTINPTHVIFVSSKSWGWAGILRYKFKDNPVVLDFTAHPNSQWWNRTAKKYGSMTGKERFIHFLNQHKLLLS